MTTSLRHSNHISISLQSSTWNPAAALLQKRLPPHLSAEDPALCQGNDSLGSDFSHYFIASKQAATPQLLLKQHHHTAEIAH